MSSIVHNFTAYSTRAALKIVPSRTAMGPLKVSIVPMPPFGPKLVVRSSPVPLPSLLLPGMDHLQLSFVIISMPFRVVPLRTGPKCLSLFALDMRLCVVALPPS